MNKWILCTTFGLFLVLLIISCTNEKESNNLKKVLIKYQWKSNKLYEAPDYRDTFIFNDDWSLIFFDAGSVSEIKGEYSINKDTVSVVFDDTENYVADKYKLIFQDSVLIHIYSDFGNRQMNFKKDRLKYRSAPKDRKLY